MPNITRPRNQGVLRPQQTRAAATVQPPASSTSPSSSPVARAKVFPPPVFPDGQRLQIPMAYLDVEPRPVWACNDNPVFNERGAAELIGVSVLPDPKHLARTPDRSPIHDPASHRPGSLVRIPVEVVR